MKLLAFDAGGTEIKYGVVEDALTISDKGKVQTPMDGFDSFAAVIHDVYLQHKDEVEGISLSLPGIIDTENGYVLGSGGAMRYRHDKEVAGLLGEKCGCKVVLENDGKAASLAELHYGALKGCQNAAVFLIGTGVGGGLIMNGEVVRGSHFQAGEFSFVNTESSAYDDYGRILGNTCSTSFLLKTYRELSGETESIDGYEYYRRLPGDEHAVKALDMLSENIAVQLHNLCWLFDPEKIAIGGGISRQPAVMEKIQEKFETVKSRSFPARIRLKVYTQIVPCRFYNDANLIGSFITYQNHR